MTKKNFYVITGGPGVGKTTLLNELSRYGFQIVPEEARRIIQEQIGKEGNGLPWKDKELYAKLMLQASVKTYKETSLCPHFESIFFDRGILDAFCYLEMEHISLSEDLDTIARENRYHQNAFILPPWQEIYKTDSERKQSWDEALSTFYKMKETYLKYNYEIIEIPKDSPINRCKFILDKIGSR